MLVLLDVRAVVDVPDGTALTPYAMALQDSSAVLFETLLKAGYEVIVCSSPHLAGDPDEYAMGVP